MFSSKVMNLFLCLYYILFCRTTTKAEESDILIYGLVDRQRAVHGDTVVVELLPTASWKSRSKALHDKTG